MPTKALLFIQIQLMCAVYMYIATCTPKSQYDGTWNLIQPCRSKPIGIVIEPLQSPLIEALTLGAKAALLSHGNSCIAYIVRVV